MTTPQRWHTSRKYTANAASRKLSPALKSVTNTSRMGNISSFGVGGTCKNTMTMTIATAEKQKFTSWKRTFSNGKIIFSMRIFLIRDDESMMEVMPEVVESAIRANIVFPKMR